MDYAGLHGGFDLLAESPPHHGEDIRLFSSSFAFAGEEVSFREAAILIFAAHWVTGRATTSLPS
jgi:aromatic ring-opening dioxygenase catalytic subunit (LigB family)